MISLSPQRIAELTGNFKNQTIMVIGDLMIDHYLWGQVSRISPEAPVPVVDIENETFRLGGAANVSYNIQTLEARALPIGVVGDDMHREKILSIFQENNFDTSGIFTCNDRSTTIKSRIIAHNQHVVRTDRECRDSIPVPVQKQMLDHIKGNISKCSAIIFEDYNKGLLNPNIIQKITEIASQNQKMIFVDPKFDNFFDFKDVTVFKPNKKELSDRLGMRITDSQSLENACKKLSQTLNCQYLLVTLGSEGMALYESGKSIRQVPTKAIQVHDVSGAGDTVISTMTVAMCAGATVEEAATMANHAAGIVVGEVGIVPIELKKLVDFLN